MLAVVGIIVFYLMMAVYIFFVDDRYYNSDRYYRDQARIKKVIKKIGLSRNKKRKPKNKPLFCE